MDQCAKEITPKCELAPFGLVKVGDLKEEESPGNLRESAKKIFGEFLLVWFGAKTKVCGEPGRHCQEGGALVRDSVEATPEF